MATDVPETPPAGGQYFAPEPAVASARATVPLVLPDLTTELVTDRGVFARDKLDVGTRLLLIDGPPLRPTSTRLVDVGCGYGPIAVALAHRAPRAGVWAVDVNRRAVELATENLRPYPNARALLAEDVPGDLTVDEVWSNPPIRIGKPALHELLAHWHARLRPGGRMVLVVQKHLGADSLQRWCQAQGWPTRRHRASATFRLLEVDGSTEVTP
jgi:16S rRNA (guanine1207-N2)-methyltransferase